MRHSQTRFYDMMGGRVAMLLAAFAFSFAVAFTGLFAFGVQQAHADYTRDCLYVGLSDGATRYYYVDSTGIYTDVADGDPATLPTGLSWDSSTYTLTMTNWTGCFIANPSTNTDHTSWHINLVGSNKLTGGYNEKGRNHFNALQSDMTLSIGGTGSLTIDNTATYSSDGRTIAVFMDKNSSNAGSITVEDSVTLDVKWIGGAMTAAFYMWHLNVNDSASVDVDVFSGSATDARVFGNGGLVCNTSGTVVLATNGIPYSGGFGWQMNGTGHLTSYSYGSDRRTSGDVGRTISYQSATGYRVYGNYLRPHNASNPTPYIYNVTPAFSICHPSRINSTVTEKSLPLVAPAAGEIPQVALQVSDSSGNKQYIADVQWCEGSSADPSDGLEFFKEHTTYKAVVSLAAMPGYTFQGLFDDDITVPGATTTSYDASTAVVTATFPATGAVVKPSISGEITLAPPVAGETAQDSISGEGYTGTVEWRTAPKDYLTTEFGYNTTYTAKVDLTIDSAYTVLGLQASDFTLKGVTSAYTVDYTEGSTTVLFKFSEPTEYRLLLTLGGENYSIDKNGAATPALPAGLSFDIASQALILDNYTGTSIVSRGDCDTLNLYLKGTNTLTGYNYTSDFIGITTPLLGLAANGGDIAIRGDSDACLNIDIEINETNAGVDRCVSGIFTQRYSFRKASFTLFDPDVNVSIADPGRKEIATRIECVAVPYYGSSDVFSKIFFAGAGSLNTTLDVGTVGSSCIKGVMVAEPGFTGSVTADVKDAGTVMNSGYDPFTSDSATHKNIGYISYRKQEQQYAYLNKDISKQSFKLAGASFEYTGSAITPEVTAPLRMIKDADYTVAYSENVMPGTAKVTIEGKGDFTGAATKTFAINPIEITDEMVSLAETTCTYSGTEKKPAVTVAKGGLTLVEGTDYTVGYADNTAVGTAKAIVTGAGVYTGTVTKTFQILPQTTITDSWVTLSATTFTYDGKVKAPTVTVTSPDGVLAEGAQYTVANLGGHVDAGSYTVTVKGVGDYNGTVKKSFVVKPQAILDKNVTTAGSTYAYQGTFIWPDVYVKNAARERLVVGIHFDVDYQSSDFTKVGVHTMAITAKGNYAGTFKRTVTIKPAKAKVSKLTPYAGKLKVTASTKPSVKGASTYKIGYKKKGSTKWKYVTTTMKTKTILKLKTGKRYYVKIRAYKKVNGKTYWGAWSATKLSSAVK